jgi:hypothetical protein
MKDDGPSMSVQPVGGRSSVEPGNSFDGILRMPTPAEALDTSIEQDARSQYQAPEADPFVVAADQPRPWRRLLARFGFGALIFLLVVSVIFIAVRRGGRVQPVQAGNFKSTHLPLGSVMGTAPITVGGTPTMEVNGRLVVSKTLTISPSTQPLIPGAGQIYYDNSSNVMSYYNGTAFVPMGGTTIQNTTNVTNVTGAGGGTGAGSITASGGTAGVLPKFTGGSTLGASIFSENGSVGAVRGNLNLVSPVTTQPPELRLWPDNPTPVVQAEPSDTNPVEVGVKFQVDVSGFITGIRFFKGATNTGTHTGTVWSSNGTVLGTATFTNESASGWQSVNFSSPIPVAAETTYVASYFAPNGNYAHDDNYFNASGHDNGTLHALQDGSDGANGVFRYTATSAFPSGGFNSLNYWVDVMFQPNPPPARYQVNGVQIASSDLANNSDLAKRTASQLFSGVNTFRSAVASQTAFSIQDVNGTAMLTADTTSTQLIVGTPGGDVNGVILVLGRKNTSGDPAGTEGAIYYNAGQSMFRCFRNALWGACADLETESAFSQYDEFMGGAVTSLASGAVIGSLGWHAEAIGANGTLDFNPATPTPIADRPGVLALTTPAVTNQGTTLMLGNGSGGSMLIQRGNYVKTSVAVSAITNQVLRIGLHNETTGTAQPLSGAWWEADPAVSNRWRYCHGDGTTATCTVSNFSIVANAWMRLEIRINGTGTGTSTIDFGINGDFLTRANITVDTTNRVSPALSCFTTTTTAQSCYWDYFQLRGTTSTYR